MPAEYEAKVLDIDPATMADLILSKGGREVASTTVQRRYVYDIVPGDQSKWIRLRDNGRQSTLLPSVWSQITDPLTFVRQLKMKAGLPADHWSPTLEAYRYGTESFGTHGQRV